MQVDLARLGTESGAADSMCCAQTAAPEGKKKKRMEMQQRGDCCIKSITTERQSFLLLRGLQRGTASIAFFKASDSQVDCGQESRAVVLRSMPS